jgi:hypothetical protein
MKRISTSFTSFFLMKSKISAEFLNMGLRMVEGVKPHHRGLLDMGEI